MIRPQSSYDLGEKSRDKGSNESKLNPSPSPSQLLDIVNCESVQFLPSKIAGLNHSILLSYGKTSEETLS